MTLLIKKISKDFYKNKEKLFNAKRPNRYCFEKKKAGPRSF